MRSLSIKYACMFKALCIFSISIVHWFHLYGLQCVHSPQCFKRSTSKKAPMAHKWMRPCFAATCKARGVHLIGVKFLQHLMALVRNTLMLLMVCHSRLPTVSNLLAWIFTATSATLLGSYVASCMMTCGILPGLYPHRVASFFSSISKCLDQVYNLSTLCTFRICL